MHVRNTHMQKFTQTTLFRSFFYAESNNSVNFYAKSNNSVNFSTYKKNAPEDAFFSTVPLKGKLEQSLETA